MTLSESLEHTTMHRSILFLTLLFLGASSDDKLEKLKILSELNEKWLLATSFPETAMLLHLPPYSYHFKDSSNRVNVSDILKNRHQLGVPATVNQRINTCSDDFVQILTNLDSNWALQMLDSDGKLSSGLLRGGIIWPGHFEECTSVYVPKDTKGHGDFHGKYCSTSWTMDLGTKFPKLPLTVGICIPESCSEEGMKTFTENMLHVLNRFPVLNQFNATLTLNSVTCKQKEKHFDTQSIIYLVFMSGFILLTVIGSAVTVIRNRKKSAGSNSEPSTCEITEAKNATTTESSETSEIDTSTKIYHVHSQITSETDDKASLTRDPEPSVQGIELEEKRKIESFATRILACFSVFENGAKILSTGGSEGQLLSIHGIRFLTLTWVVLGHTYISSVSIIGNRLDVLKEMDSVPFQVLLASPFSVDTFFLLSGFLLAYLFFKEADKTNGKINWIYFYLHRLWRLTPVYMVIVFFYMYVFKYFGSGPFWEDNHCDNTHDWWKYLLYINNFIPINQMCIGWSWYLANDMQFYIISPLFLYPLWRWPAIGCGLLASLLLGTWITTGVISYQNDLIPMFVGVTHTNDFDAYSKKMWESFDLIYDKPYCRIAPYIIGVALGFILYKVNNRKSFMNWWQQVLGWTISLFCSLSVIFGLFHVDMSRTTSLFYNALCRSSFSIALAWIIFICETGHGGFISTILSWKFFIPLSRLTYCAYLVHPILIHGYYFAYQTALHFTELVMVTNFMGFLVMSYGMAFALSLTFESPLMNLEKLVLKGRKK